MPARGRSRVLRVSDALTRLGEMLKVMPKNEGAKGIGTSAVPIENRTPTLADLGIDKEVSMVARP